MDLKPYLIVMVLMLLPLIIYIGFHLQTSERQLIPISVIALIAGVIFETRRIADKWIPVLLMALGAFIFSFLAFLPGKGEYNYDLETHIKMWPYAFIFFFIIASLTFHGDKVIPKLTEGITLLQSIAAIYWVIDYGFIDTHSVLLKLLMILGLSFSLYAVFHAFNYAALTVTSRLTLSIWSSIIMLLFSLDNIYRVYQNEQIENTIDTTHGLYIGLQYFLLGISSIYIVQNILMLTGFLPGRGKFFNAQYFKELKALKSDHIKRYSDRQVNIIHSFFCVLFTGIIFILNHYFQILPRHLAIWTVFAVFPFVLILYDYTAGKKTKR